MVAILRVFSLTSRVFSDLVHRVILMFYPLYVSQLSSRAFASHFINPSSDFTFVCPTEILAFNDALPEFARLNTTVLGTRFFFSF